MRHLGCFVSSAGGLFNAINNAEELQINTFMIHPAPPQKWNSQPFKQEAIDAYNKRMEEHQNSAKVDTAITAVEKVYFHGIYLINLANPDKQKFHLSKLSLVNHLDLCMKINADGVIFHTGNLKDWKNEDEGLDRVIYGINWIFENVEVKGQKLFLECAAGAGGTVIGDKFEELARIYEGIKEENKEKVGFCLDTQHMFGSGYDLINDLDNVVDQADNILGLDKIPVIHFNDSKVDLASNKDRHEDLGKGKIGEQAMRNFLNHPKLKDKAFILETPGLGTPEGSHEQMKLLKEWAI